MLPSPIRPRAALLLAAFGIAFPPAAARCFGAVATPANFVDEIVAAGFSLPTGFVFLPDGRILVTEQRTGNVRMVVNGAATPAILTVPLLNAVAHERGLLSIAVDPKWPERPWVYLFYTRIGSMMRVVRYTATGALEDPASASLALVDPYLILDDLSDFAGNHNGGTLRFDPDGFLYLSVGEDASMCSAQDPTLLRGVLMRLDVDSLPAGPGGPATRAQITPADNPFVGSSNANARLVWAYGLRNPFRYAIDPESRKVYLGDVGANAWEEVDEIEAGDNLGWPHREGYADFFSFCTPPVGFAPRAPIAAYDHSDGIAVIGAGTYRPRSGALSNWPPEYWGDVFYADYYSGLLRRLSWDGATWTAEAAPGQPNLDDWANGLPTPVDFQLGPDGSFWWLSQDGSIHRLRYTGQPLAADGAPPRLGTLSAVSPFTGSTELAFALGRAGRARITIYDVRGRRVRALLDATLGAGSRRMRWDGHDDDGRSVPSGMYFVRLDHADGRAVTRTLRLR